MSEAQATPVAPPPAVNPARGLPIGWPVLFYVGGTRAHLPAPAIVFRNHGNGVLDLLELRWGADQKQRPAARHVADPLLAENPKLREQSGAWDFVMGLMPPEDIPIFPSSMNPDGRELEVLVMAARGESRGDIANATGVNPKKVGEIIERFHSCLP